MTASISRRNDDQVMAQFPQGCSDKHGREMKMKDLNLAEESDINIGLAFLELGKVLSRHAL